MLNMKILILSFILLMAGFANANNPISRGKILRVDMSGGESTWGPSHYNVVQLQIENGFHASGCDSKYAAIRKEETHMVSAVLAAFMAGKEIEVQLSAANIYFPGRCIITDIFVYP